MTIQRGGYAAPHNRCLLGPLKKDNLVGKARDMEIAGWPK
jgi:hypothetical protein